VTKKHKPRSGSLQFYPRVRSAKPVANFTTFPKIIDGASKPMEFFGYKAGMLHVIAKDLYDKSATYGYELRIPATVIEAPPMKVFGIRAYGNSAKGKYAITEVLAEKQDKHLGRRIKNLKPKGNWDKIESVKGKISEIKLLAHAQPYFTGIGKKKPEVMEIALSGDVNAQMNYAKEIMGKEISANDVFSDNEIVDARAVTIGKGFQGVVKRFGVRTLRRKAKKERMVGSIGPWNPSLVMWTVARAGQMGYHARTEYNKRILKIFNSPERLNPSSGFEGYGTLRSTAILVSGSLPGHIKRVVALRKAIRKSHIERKLSEITFISTKPEVAKSAEEEVAMHKVKAEKKVEKEEKSVQDEIAMAVKGEKEKKEKEK